MRHHPYEHSEIDPKKLGSLLLPYRRQEIVDDLISLPTKAVKNVLKENELIEIMTKFLFRSAPSISKFATIKTALGACGVVHVQGLLR